MWKRSREGEFNDENVLNGLQPLPNIKILHIVGFEGASFPMWTLKMAVRLEGRWIGLSILVEIILSSCGEFEEIPMLGHLPHLKSLGLRNLKNVKCRGASFYGIGECSSSNGTVSVFPSLEQLLMVSMPGLREWEEVEIPCGAQVKVFPCLKCLEIRGCKELRSAPSQFTSLKELIIDRMDSELPLASICSIQLKMLTNLQIERIEGLRCRPDWLFHNNQYLSMLSCPKLRKLPNSLNYLKDLNLEECDKLQSSVSGKKLQGLTSLRRLSISGCKVVKSFLGEMEDSWVSSLEELRIGAGK